MGSLKRPSKYRLDLLNGTLNLRPVYGLPPSRRILRSGNLGALSAQDIKGLREEVGINHYLDLRNQSELVPEQLRRRFRECGANWQWFPLGEFPARFREQSQPSSVDYSDYYLDILHNNSEILRDLLSFVGEAECRNFVFGCTLGKDRTGVVAFLLLALAGAPVSIIAGDYWLSKDYILQRADCLAPHWEKRGMNREAYLHRIVPHKETMYIFAQEIGLRFGDVTGYLKGIGVADATIRLIQRLLRE